MKIKGKKHKLEKYYEKMRSIFVFLATIILAFLITFSTLTDELDEAFEEIESTEVSTPAKKEEPAELTPQNEKKASLLKAQVSYIDGEVRRRQREEPDWQPVVVHAEVESAEKVRTLADSRAEILLDQEKAIRLAPKTTVDLLKLFKEEEQNIATAINVDEGSVWANIARMDEGVNLSINSKLTAAAVRGTVFSVTVAHNAATEIKVYRGQVEVYNPFPKDTSKGTGVNKVKPPHEVAGPKEVPGPKVVSLEEWSKIILNANQSLSIAPGEKKPTVTTFSQTDPAEQSDWIKWNQMRDKLFESIRKKQ